MKNFSLLLLFLFVFLYGCKDNTNNKEWKFIDSSEYPEGIFSASIYSENKYAKFVYYHGEYDPNADKEKIIDAGYVIEFHNKDYIKTICSNVENQTIGNIEITIGKRSTKKGKEDGKWLRETNDPSDTKIVFFVNSDDCSTSQDKLKIYNFEKSGKSKILDNYNMGLTDGSGYLIFLTDNGTFNDNSISFSIGDFYNSILDFRDNKSESYASNKQKILSIWEENKKKEEKEKNRKEMLQNYFEFNLKVLKKIINNM